MRTSWLLLLLRTQPSYGYVLRRELAQRGVAIEPSMLYRTLRDLEGDGWIVSSWQAPAGGPRARVYTLTKKGDAALEALAATIEGLRDAQAAFLTAYEGAVAGPPPDPSDAPASP